MARRGQTINVKVPRKKVIVALEKALKKLEVDYANIDKNEKAFEKRTKCLAQECIYWFKIETTNW
jgi:chaperonin cofactor prefoldin